MDHKDVFAAIAHLEEKYLPMWREICEIESPTACKAGVDAVADYCIRHAESLGWEVVRGSQPVSGDPVCITMNPDSPEQAICLSAHMDTVHPVGTFGSPAVRTDGENIYGPGVHDCKGNIIAAFMTMEALQQCGYNKRPVKLILQSDEETGSAGSSKHTVDFMEQSAKGCLCFLNMEPHIHPKITVQRKGIMKFRFDITGKAGHAGKCYQFTSAITEAAHKILAVEKWKEADGITCNVGTISGGTGINVVPESCSFAVDVRFANDEQQARIAKYMQQVADTSYLEGTTCQLTLVSTRVSMPRTEAAMALLERMNEIFAQTDLPELIPTMAPGGSDCADMVSRGFTAVDSLGIEGGGSHSIKEWARLSSLIPCCQRVGALLWYL